MMILVFIISLLMTLILGIQGTTEFELLQYNKYLNISRAILPTNSTTEQELFHAWKELHKLGRASISKAVDFSYNSAIRFPSIWDRVSDQPDCSYSAVFNKFTGPSESNPRIRISFIVDQSKCISKTPILGGGGIEAFAMMSQYKYVPDGNGYYSLESNVLVRCSTEDRFSNKYISRCVAPFVSKIDNRPPMFCFNVSFYVEYEHFDAFADFKIKFASLNHRITVLRSTDKLVNVSRVRYTGLRIQNWDYFVVEMHTSGDSDYLACFEPLAVDQQSSNGLFVSNVDTEQAKATVYEYGSSPMSSAMSIWDQGYWTDRFIPCNYSKLVRDSNYSHNISYAKNQKHRIRIDLSRNLLPFWSSSIGADYLPRQQIEFCFKFTRAVFIGPSHMRFDWDYLAKLYFMRDVDIIANLTQFHSTTHLIEDFFFEAKDFSEEVASQLLLSARLPIATDHGKFNNVIIIQTGTWDISHIPLRNFINNPDDGANVLVSAIETVIDSRLDSSVDLLHLVVITTFPQLHYTEEKGWHNNYVVQAANSYFEGLLLNMLSQKGATSSRRKLPIQSFNITRSRLRLTLYRTFPMVASMLESVHPVGMCKNHGVCRGIDSNAHANSMNKYVYKGILPGMVILSTIMQAICGNPRHLLMEAKKLQNNSNDDYATSPVNQLVNALLPITLLNESRWLANRYHEFDVIHAVGNYSSYYIISMGFRHLIPNNDTLHIVLFNINIHSKLSQSECIYAMSANSTSHRLIHSKLSTHTELLGGC